MDIILQGLESLLGYIHMFFFSTPAFTQIFKILFIAHVVFLIYTAFHPAKGKWIALFVSTALYLTGGAVVFGMGCTGDDIGYLGFGIMYMVVALILFFATLAGLSRNSNDGPSAQ